MLIDLDLAKEEGKGPSGARHRTGTMEFMAIEVLQGTSHTYRHDIEAFFYVLIWLCARRGWALAGTSKKPPTETILSHWYTGTYKDIARNKRGDMDKDGLEVILEECSQRERTSTAYCRRGCSGERAQQASAGDDGGDGDDTSGEDECMEIMHGRGRDLSPSPSTSTSGPTDLDATPFALSSTKSIGSTNATNPTNVPHPHAHPHAHPRTPPRLPPMLNMGRDGGGSMSGAASPSGSASPSKSASRSLSSEGEDRVYHYTGLKGRGGRIGEGAIWEGERKRKRVSALEGKGGGEVDVGEGADEEADDDRMGMERQGGRRGGIGIGIGIGIGMGAMFICASWKGGRGMTAV
ncbi:serine threonine-protein kinase sgk2 [Lasallia pustulata]|uniref:Serine threonine-protein kinase sgk2 n=1 Tax=Lasallia pustulata TaxID=136370 RepID=A0A1W5DB51_9LECA|nr:serine threonine-protein kinase sgk2 [Lasallia pustulata]